MRKFALIFHVSGSARTRSVLENQIYCRSDLNYWNELMYNYVVRKLSNSLRRI